MKKTSDTVSTDEPIATSGQIFPGGTMLDLVEGMLPDRSLSLLVWNGKKAQIAKEFQFGGRTYTPVSLPAVTLEAIRFPSLPVTGGSTTELSQKILDAILKYSGYPLRDLRVVPYFVLASWVADFLPMPPTLVVTSPSPAEARRFLRLLRCFCRHGVVVTELTPSGFWTLPMELRPTLLIDISGLTRSVHGLLRASSGRRAYIARRGELADPRCVKAIYSTKSDVDTAVSEGLLRVAALPAPGRSLFLDEREEEKIAAEFQPQLLDYRLQNYRAVQESRFDAPGFTTGVRELAQTLGAAVAGDPELQKNIISLLSRQDDDARIRQTTLPEFGIITALLSLLHEQRKSELMVSEFTNFVNAALRANGEILKYSPEEIGRRIAAMGLFTNRTNRGNVIQLTRQISRLAHDLSRRYGVTTTPTSFPGCPDCEPTDASGKKRLV